MLLCVCKARLIIGSHCRKHAKDLASLGSRTTRYTFPGQACGSFLVIPAKLGSPEGTGKMVDEALVGYVGRIRGMI